MFPPAFEVGVEIGGRFRLAKLLAAGGMAQAFLAWDNVEQRPVVVKHPRRALLDDELFVARFHREVEALRSLQHPHVIPLIEAGMHERAPYFVMPLMAGGSLVERFPRGERREQIASRPASLHQWLPAVAAALDYAHGQGIVHRDVKPANIFFDSSRTPLLGDFGLVKSLEEESSAEDSLTCTNTALGTLFYMAPERFRPNAEPERQADQYSLAVCVYEALAGRRPFVGDTHHLAVEHLTLPPPPLPCRSGDSVPESLRQALERALSKQPAERFATCSEFAAAVLGEIPMVGCDETVAELLCPACRRLIRLNLALAGQKGHCSRCRATLAIGPACEWLWHEEPRPAAHVAAVPASGRRWRYGALVGVGAAVVLVGFALRPGGEREQENNQGSVVATLLDVPEPFASPVVVDDSDTPGDGGSGDPDGGLSAAGGSDDSRTEPLPTHTSDGENEGIPDPDDASDQDEKAPQPALKPDLIAESPTPAADAGSNPDPAEPSSSPEAVEPPSDPPVAATADVFPNRVFLDMHWVLVDDPGNPADANGGGAVMQPYLIGRYEVTNAEYCVFLNGSEAGRSNSFGVADGPSRAATILTPEDCDRGIIRSQEAAGDGFRYDVAPSMHDKPVVNLCWSDAARYANWLHNGGRAGADTESGAYDLAGVEREDVHARHALPEARGWIPTLDEWYKAAFAKRKEGKVVGYWKFPTASDSQPKAIKAHGFGGGAAEQNPDNTANFTKVSRWPKDPPDGIKPAEWKKVGAATSVGTNGKPSDFGAYDMAGNVAELVFCEDASSTGIVGGDCSSRTKPPDFSSAVVAACRVASRETRLGGLRLACREHPAILIKSKREYLPLGAIEESLSLAQQALALVFDAPPATMNRNKLDELLGKLKTTSRTDFPDDVLNVLAKMQALLEAVTVEMHHLLRAGNVLNQSGATQLLRRFWGDRVVRELSALDQEQVEMAVADAYEKHRQQARTLNQSCEALKKALGEQSHVRPPAPIP